MTKTVPILIPALLIALSNSGCGGSSETSACQFDTTSGFDTRNCDIEGLDGEVVLNEFTAAGNDEIELFNTSSEAIDIGGWLLTDQVEAQRIDTYDPLSDSEKFVFPTGTVIAPGAYVVIPKGDAELAHSFGISKDADIISLVSPNGKLIDQSSAGPDEAEPSYCRVPDGEGEWQKCESTFGTANIPFACGNGVLDEGEACDGTQLGDATCNSTSPVFNGGDLSCSADCQLVVEACTSDAPCDSDAVVLNEVCHKNSLCGVDGVTSSDWLELYNPTDEAAEVSGCYIQVIDQGVQQRRVLIGSIPEFQNATIEPGAFWLASDNGTLFKAGKDESVILLDAEQNEINTLITSSALSRDGDSQSTACRIDDGTNQSTPGSSNNCSP